MACLPKWEPAGASRQRRWRSRWKPRPSGRGGSHVSGYGYLLFLLGSVSWTAAGLRMREPSIWSLNLAFSAINILGIVRWLG